MASGSDSDRAGAGKGDAEKWPKRKVAMIIGYCGTGYQGLQLWVCPRRGRVEPRHPLCASTPLWRRCVCTVTLVRTR